MVDINRPKTLNISNPNVHNYGSSQMYRAPITQVKPMLNNLSMGNQATRPPTNEFPAQAPYPSGHKRQKISEYADFTNENSGIPGSRSVTQNTKRVPTEESKSEVQLIEDLRSHSTSGSPSKFKGLKTVSEAITTNYAEKLEGKETEIKELEFVEESKIINAGMDELSFQAQRSISKDHKPLYESSTGPKHIKCFCGDHFACDETRLIQ